MKSCEHFFRKSQFSTLTDLNLGFGAMDIFCKCHLHNTSKEVFWPFFFSNFIHRFKSVILPDLKNCQNGNFEPMHEIQKIFLMRFLLKHYEVLNQSPISTIPLIVRNLIDQKTVLTVDPLYLARLESKIRQCFYGSLLYKNSVKYETIS